MPIWFDQRLENINLKTFEEKREELVGDKKKVDVKLQKKMVRDKNKEYYG